jgi:quinone-modifying oxidoreductase subunit QmoC
MAGNNVIEPDVDFIREIKKAGGDNLNKCYQCATCSAVCNLSPSDRPFPRKEMLMAQWGRAGELLADPDIWICFQCNDCSTYCPRGARPGDVLAAVRSYAYKKMAFPSFMGPALASPKALPWLLLIPVIILVASIFLFSKGPDGEFLFVSNADIDFDYFLRHSFVDAFFVFGNIIIFIFAAVGFLRFWRMLKKSGPAPRISFVTALIKVAGKIFTHSDFNKCGTNKPRAVGHMLLFFGFIGAMITTGAVLLLIFLPHYLELLGLESLHAMFALPLSLPNPIKILGALSGVALCAGGIWLIVRRWKNKDNVGANGYADYLFLYMLTLVGLTGMMSWLVRVAGIAWLAYASYFLHLVVVFFLLWYMPYSKFAHMIYRLLALVYARSIGRSAAP